MIQTYSDEELSDVEETTRDDRVTWSQKNPEFELHFDEKSEAIACSHCGEQPIVDRRYTCTENDCEFDCCEDCIDFHPRNHQLMLLRKSAGARPKEDLVFAVSSILEHEKRNRKNFFRVRYKGSFWKDEWLSEEHLHQDLISEYFDAVKKRRYKAKR